MAILAGHRLLNGHYFEAWNLLLYIIYVFTSLAKENCFPLNCLNKLIIFTLNQILNGEREGTLLTVDDSLEIFCELDQAGFGGIIVITGEMKMPSKNSFFKKVSDWYPNS